ncbi:MAG: HNH endonuclease [Euryarchaeota archaeon]|nr:HNH endonuclease [Euryarchaeota archaeon]
MSSILPCQHRLISHEESYCWLESNRLNSEGLPTLVFYSFEGNRPLRCTEVIASICPWRLWTEDPVAKLVPCSNCNRRHRQGSTSQQLCVAWSEAKITLKMMRKIKKEGEKYYPEGTRELPYSDSTSAVVRRLVWRRMKSAILRRDRYQCQECNIEFNRRRRKIFDPSLRKGSGGYRWESLEVHHIIPRYEGGSDHPGNLMTLCPSCHLEHTSRQASERAKARKNREKFLSTLEVEECNNELIFDPRD